MNSSGAFFVVNGDRIDLSYNKANLPYARATTARIEADIETIEAKVCYCCDINCLARRVFGWCIGCRSRVICMAECLISHLVLYAIVAT